MSVLFDIGDHVRVIDDESGFYGCMGRIHQRKVDPKHGWTSYRFVSEGPSAFETTFRGEQLEMVPMGRFHLLIYEEFGKVSYALFDDNHFDTAVKGMKQHRGTIRHLGLNVFPKTINLEDMVGKVVED
jgi:hypothetical protein